MNPVTDPAILAQLEGGEPSGPQPGELRISMAPPAAPTGLKPVTDPAILAQLEPDAHPRFDPIGDIGREASAGANAVVEGGKKVFSTPDQPRGGGVVSNFVDELKRTGEQTAGALEAAGGAVKTAMSPVMGAIKGTAGSLYSLLPGMNKQKADEAVDLALSALPRPMAPALRATPAAVRLANMDAANITPRLPAVTQDRGSGIIANAVKEVPIGGTPLVEGARANLAEGAAEAERIAGGYGTARSEAEAGRGVQQGLDTWANADPAVVPNVSASQPSRQIGFGNKSDALYDRVQGLIPQGAALDTTNTQAALRATVQSFPSNAVLGESLTNPQIARWSEALANGTLTWPELRAFRTRVRMMRGDSGLRMDVDQVTLNNLERAMTADLTAGAQAVGGPQAVRAFQNADRFYAAGMQRVEALQKLTSTTSPEQAFERLITAAQDAKSTSNIQLLNQARRSLGPDEWGNVASTLIERMGQPKAGNVAEGMPRFSFAEFQTNYEKLSPAARSVLFDNPANPALRPALDRLAQVAGDMKNVGKLGNPSGTARSKMAGMITMGPGAFMAGGGEPLTALAVAAGALASTRGAAFLLNSPGFARLIVRAGQMQPRYLGAWAQQVSALADQDPELKPHVKEFLANLAPGEPATVRRP